MVAKLLIAGLLAGVLAAPAAAQQQLLMPGVTYEKQVQFTLHGPVVIHVITAPKPGGLYSLRPVLSNDAVTGVETVTSIEKRLSATATVAGVNGDLFNFNDGHPSGGLLRSGVLDHAPLAGRSLTGVDTAGNVHVDRVAFFGTWQGSSQRRALSGLNEPPSANGVSLFTPSWGPTTPAVEGTLEVVLFPFPAATPNVDLAGPVVQVKQGGATPIPAGGAVLVARGPAAEKLQAEAPVGQNVIVRLILKPDLSGIVDAFGGGPVLVRDGRGVFRAQEEFRTEQLLPLNPRTSVGQLADGRILLVAVDGRQPGYSTGMTNFELSQTMVRLGAVTASALDAGGSTTMAFDGTLLNRPSDPGGERQVAEALLVFYTGVYAPLPSEPVLSPNGDGVAESEQLAYKVVRPSAVTASLIGPDGAPHFTETVQRDPGAYPLSWPGITPEGQLELEGPWRWVVTAVDDQAQSSTSERPFWLNTTLGFLKRSGPTLSVPRKAGRVMATFRLAHPARVTATIETLTGVVLRTIRLGSLAEGDRAVAWNGRDDRQEFAYPGRYVLRVAAGNELGRVDLTTQVAVRQLALPRAQLPTSRLG